MHKTLVINAHPDYQNRQHNSIRFQDYVLNKIKNDYPETEVTVLNVYQEDIPAIDSQTYEIYRKNAACIDLNEEERTISQRSRALLDQFKDHHRIIIASPLHNFNIPARLKDYLDNVLIARETYQYTKTGSVGLMTDDYKVLYLQSSGSIYTNNDRYTSLEFSNFYLKEMFENIMGFDKYYIARFQGTDLSRLDINERFEIAKNEADAILPAFYSSDSND